MYCGKNSYLGELSLDLLCHLTHLRQELLDRSTQRHRGGSIADLDSCQDSILGANRDGQTGLLGDAPGAMRHAKALRARFVEQSLDFNPIASQAILRQRRTRQ